MEVSFGALLVALSLVAVGCGGGDDTPEDGEYRDTTSGSERERERDDGSEITGLMGTIRRDQVENALSPRMGRFQRCFTDRSRQVELLAGEIRMSFRVHTDGSVAWVYPHESDIGDRDTERCILGVAASTRFPRPRGGEAEFSWGFALDMASDVRPPLTWQADALGSREGDLRTLARGCHANGNFSVTAYIEPGGVVLAAGGTMPDAESESALDCILDEVRGWTLADPGSYPAKIRFGVPR